MAESVMRTRIVLFLLVLVMSCFVLIAAWGTIDMYRAGWCAGSLIDCDALPNVLLEAGACALLAGCAAIPTTLTSRNKIAGYPSSTLLSLAVSCAVLAVFVYPLALKIRSLISDRYFPYVTAIRFGSTGFFIVWTLLNLVVITIVIAVACRWLGLRAAAN